MIGMTTVETPVDTKQEYIEGIPPGAHDDALVRCLPMSARRSRWSDVSPRSRLAFLAADLGVDRIGGGRCHKEIIELKSDIPLVQSTSYPMGYHRLGLRVDLDAEGER